MIPPDLGRTRPASERFCSRCRKWKSTAEFKAIAWARDGLACHCKPCAAYKRLGPALSGRLEITQPNLLDVVDRSDRRADLAEIGGLRGVHEIRRRLAIVRAAKGRIGGLDLSDEALAAVLPA